MIIASINREIAVNVFNSISIFCKNNKIMHKEQCFKNVFLFLSDNYDFEWQNFLIIFVLLLNSLYLNNRYDPSLISTIKGYAEG